VMTKYQKPPVNGDGWTGWFYPAMLGYKISCCDCGLVHQINFKIDNDRVLMDVKRDNRATGQKRRRKQFKITIDCEEGEGL